MNAAEGVGISVFAFQTRARSLSDKLSLKFQAQVLFPLSLGVTGPLFALSL